MSITYKEAMAELSSMFGTFDREMIKSVLVANEGDLDKTIEDLLKISEEAAKINPQALQEDEDDNLFSNLTTSSTKNPQSTDDNLFSIDDSPSNNFSLPSNTKNQSSSHSLPKKTHDDSIARKLQEEADEEFARRLQEDIIADAQNQAARQNRQLQKTNGSHYSHKQQDFIPPQENELQYDESEEEDEQDPSTQKQPKEKKPGFGSKLKSAFGGLFKKKKKNSDAAPELENHNPKASTSSKQPIHDLHSIPHKDTSKTTAQKKPLATKESAAVHETSSNLKTKLQTGDEEIYTFYFDGPPKFRFRPGFHQFNGVIDEENKENPVEFIVTDYSKSGKPSTTYKSQKNTATNSEFFDLDN